MNDTSGTERPTPPQGAGRPGLDPGIPVGLKAAAPGQAHPLPNWVIPMVVLALVAGLGVGLAVGMLIGGGGSGEAATTTGAAASTTAAFDPALAYGAAVTVEGDALPALAEGTQDAALGRVMPSITGTDYAGNTLSITPNGKAKVIIALAHWCPYCNQEIPILNDWFAAGVPAEIEVFALSVYADPAKANFPPATWVQDTEFALPLIADDANRTLVRTLGIPAVPFWVAVLPDGRVALRTTGQLDAATIDQIVAALLAPRETTTTTAP